MATAEVGCSLTAVFDARGRALTKRFEVRRGQLVKTGYPNVAEFQAVRLPFEGFDGFAAVLEMVAADGRAAVIRAEPGRWYPQDGSPAFRLLSPQPSLVYAGSGRRVSAATIKQQKLRADGADHLDVVFLPMFEERPRAWVILDIDRPAVPAHLASDWVDHPEEVVEHVLELLAEPFQPASCWWSISSSAAVPTPTGRELSAQIKLKLGFLLDRRLSSGELKSWLRGSGAPVDPSTLNAIQLTYIAPPRFSGGLHDPVPRRSGVWQGAADVVEVPDSLPELEHAGSRSKIDAFGPLGDLDELVAALRERLEGEIHVREHLAAAISSYVHGADGTIDAEALVSALTSLAEEFRTPTEVAGYNLDSLVDWHLARKPAEPPPHFAADDELEAGEASARLRRLVNDAIDATFENRGHDPPQLAVRAAAGLGKTRAVTEALQEHPGRLTEIYVPTLSLAKEIAAGIKAAGIDCQIIRGREAKVNGEPLCQKHEEAAILARAGLPIGSLLCRQRYDDGTEQLCEYFRGCAYVDQFRAQPFDPLKLLIGRPTVRIMSHAYLFLPRVKQLVAPDPPPPNPELAIIDESFWSAGVRQTSFGADRLTAVRPAGLPVEVEADLHELSHLARTAFERGQDPRDALSLEEIKRARDNEATLVFKLAPISPGMRHTRQRERLAELRSSGAARLWRFWRVLHEAAQQGGPLLQIVFRRDVPTPGGELQDRIDVYWRATWRLPNVPVILLDASLEPLIARKFLPRLRVERIAARRNAEIVQVRDTACSMNRLLSYEAAGASDQARAGRRLTEVRTVAEAEASSGRKVALITYKRAAERLGSVRGVDVLHLGGLRGLDLLKDHDSIVVAGRLQPGPEAVEASARSLFGDDAEPLNLPGRYIVERRGYRCRDGRHRGVDVQVHADARVQAILEQSREREVEQAVDRLRLIHRGQPARVILMTNLPVDLTVDRFAPWRQLLPTRWWHTARALRGCLPLSPSELARLLPAVWGTAEAAKHHLKRGDKKGGQNPIESLYWEMAPLSTSATLVEYRRPGQRGSPHRAWLAGTFMCREAARRALLQAGFGELSVDRIVETWRPPRQEPSPPPAAPVETRQLEDVT